MTIDLLPDVEEIARHFRRALLDSRRNETPYRHWTLVDTLPESLCLGLISLPIAPQRLDDCGGVRDLDNGIRCFMTPRQQSRHPVFAHFAEAMQRPDVARLTAETCGFQAEGSFLRMEYIQDVDGAWLEPHHDVPEKLCSIVIYLCTGPDCAEWGTDIYDAERKWVGRSSGIFNSGSIFIPGENTWHGFEKRKIIGIRRLLEINYVHPSWRDKEQLCFPDRPVTVR
ncbi:MAG TPA: hypothetical protein VM661_18955 [Candidatus Sulfotelmatobacter sp.]|jgi:hypothetical protein|nr:hypothetical protein [Candidatus Sulfotelmatobacter sp.]